jgi:hypothetical protein
MAVCKKCGCAIPLGSKSCDMCAAVGSVAPAYQPQASSQPPVRVTYTPPTPAAVPPPPAGALPQPPPGWSYASTQPAPIPAARPAHIQRAEKEVQAAWHWLAIVGAMYIVLGGLTTLGYMDDLSGLFGGWALAIGATFLVLAYFVRQGYILALVMAVAVYALYTIAFFAAGSFAIIRILVLAWLLRKLYAMYMVRQHRQARAQQPPGSEQTRVA